MERSIKQITKAFETFATSHKIIKDFKSNIIQKNIAKDWIYPLMYTNVGNARLENGQIQLSMDIYFIDLPGNEDSYTQKLSDMLRVSEDFYTYFNHNEQSFGFYFNDIVNAEPIVLQFEDTVIGYKLPIIIQIKMLNDENNIAI
jgi:hypothetical protein